jgi:predicted transposase/invertase (TIGR01784 family)
MAKTIHKAKDNSFKLVFNEPELFVEFLRDYIPVGLLKDVKPTDIEDMTERYLPLFQDSKDSDTVKRVNLKGRTPLFVIAILEHESKVNFRTCFKMLQYISLVLHEYEKEANKENPNASSAKDFKYPPVLPIVFYDGMGEWTAETNFLDKTELSDVFEKYIPKFEYELVDLNRYDEQDIADFGNALSLIMIIDKIRDADGISMLRKLPRDYIGKLKQNIPPHLYKLLADVITVFLKRISVPDDEIDRVTEHLHDRGIQEMFTFIDNYDVQETRRIARAEGRAEVFITVARKLLKAGDSVEKVSEVTGLSLEDIERIRDAN